MTQNEPEFLDERNLEDLEKKIIDLEAECTRLRARARQTPANGKASAAHHKAGRDRHSAQQADTNALASGDMSAGLAYIDLEERHRKVHGDYARVLGIVSIGIVGKTLSQVLHPEFYRHVTPHLEAARSGLTIAVDGAVGGSEDAHRDVRLTMMPDLGDDGSVDGVYISVQDLAELRNCEATAKRCEQRFRYFAESSSHFLWEMGPDLKFSYVSSGITSVTGESPSEFIGKSRRDIAGKLPVDPEALKKNLAEMEQRQSFRNFLIERPHVSEDRTVHLRISGTPLFSPDGQFLGYRGTAHDVSAQREMLSALQRSEEKYRDLIEGSIQGMYIAYDWNPLFANKACADIFGYDSVEDFLSIGSIGMLIGPKDRKRLDRYRKKRLRGEKVPMRHTAEFRRKDGSAIWLESINRVVDWEGISAIQTTIVDVTEKKRAEDILLRSREDLEIKVARRTADLERINNTLKQKVAELEKAKSELKENRTRLSDAIESISDGFVLFDANERLVLCNRRYREMYAGIADRLTPGTSLRELLLATAERGLVQNLTTSPQEWVEARIREYRGPVENMEQEFSDGRWINASIRRTTEGGIVGIRSDITERKLAEIVLKESQERLQQAADLAGIGYCIWDSIEDRCIYCSEEYARVHGTTVEDYLASAASATADCPFTHPDDRAAYRAATEKLRQEGAGFGLEYRMMWPSGEMRYVRTIVKPVFDNNGRVIQEYLTIQDITEQKETEIALRNSRELLMAIIDHAPAEIDIKDEAGRFVLINRPMEELFGTNREEVLGNTSWDFFSEEEAAACDETHKRVLQTGEDLTTESVRFGDDGERNYLAVKFKIPQIAGGGAAVGRISTDITELKRREAALREYQELMETIMDTAPVSITVKDQDCRYVYINRHELKAFGLEGADYIGKIPEDFVSQDMASQIRALDRKVLESGRATPQYEEHFADADNRMRHWLSAKVPVIVDDSVRYVVTVCLDITDTKEREEALRQAQKMETLGRLTGGIAHDFNNLLAVINGHTLFLQRKADFGPETAQHLEAIETVAKLGTALTGGLLSFARQDEFALSSVDLRELINGAMKSLFLTLPSSIKIDTEFESDLSAAKTDRHQLQIALFNIVLNAKDALPDGGTVTISAKNTAGCDEEQTHHPGRWVEVTVKDNGTGIPRDQIDRIFDPFFSTKPAGSGTGLGLSMVERFIENSKGRIKISSEPGAGTTVTMLLPRAESGKETTDALNRVVMPEGGSETVLVAEDNAAVRRMAVQSLSELGYNVLEAENGEQALEILNRDMSVALLFSDIELGGPVDGYALARECSIGHQELKVLLCTGHSSAHRPPERYAGKLPPLLLKPYDPNKLGNAVRDVLDSGALQEHGNDYQL